MTNTGNFIWRLANLLNDVMPSGEIDAWVDTPNKAFGGVTPAEVIQHGDDDVVEEMILYLERELL